MAGDTLHDDCKDVYSGSSLTDPLCGGPVGVEGSVGVGGVRGSRRPVSGNGCAPRKRIGKDHALVRAGQRSALIFYLCVIHQQLSVYASNACGIAQWATRPEPAGPICPARTNVLVVRPLAGGSTHLVSFRGHGR